MEPFEDFGGEVVEGFGVQGVAVEGEGEAGEVHVLGDVEELGFGHLAGHAFEGAEVDDGIDLSGSPNFARTPGQDRLGHGRSDSARRCRIRRWAGP